MKHVHLIKCKGQYIVELENVFIMKFPRLTNALNL